MRTLLATGTLVAGITLTACSSGSTHGNAPNGVRPGTGSSTTPLAGIASPAQPSGNFCSDIRALTNEAAVIGRSALTSDPAQVKQAVEAVEQLERTAAAEAPAGLGADIALASNDAQFAALAAAGYDLTKVDLTRMHPTPVQQAALGRVRRYVISNCGFDPAHTATGTGTP